MATLSTKELTKSYGGRTVVKGVSSRSRRARWSAARAERRRQDDDVLDGGRADRARFRRVLLNGADITDDPMYIRARKGIGYLPQEPSIFRGLSVEQNIIAILETLNLDGGDAAGAAARTARGAVADAAGQVAGLHALGRRAAAGRRSLARW